jgi:hypothetical protein
MDYFLSVKNVDEELYETMGLVKLPKEDGEMLMAKKVPHEHSDTSDDEPMIVFYLETKVQDSMDESMSLMDQVHTTGKAFFEALAQWDGEGLQDSILAEILRDHATKDSRAMLAFQVLGLEAGTSDEMTKETKLFAIELAETMGPDWAQWLYHFAKLVTKLA